MATKKIDIKSATIKILTGFIPHIGKYAPGALKEGDLPIKVIIRDSETAEEFDAELIHVVPFKYEIPQAFSLLSNGISGLDCHKFYFAEHKVNSIENLAFYIYQHVKTNE